MGERQVALQPARVEVVVQSHHQQRDVDVADDRMPATVPVDARQVIGGLHPRHHPATAVRIVLTQHPVADRQRGAVVGQAARQTRLGPRDDLAVRVVQRQRLPVDLGDAREPQP